MLTSNFRVETFNITAVGTVKSFFAQGGVRYQQATLISGESVTFASIKIHPLSSSKVKKAIPGSFKCSNKLYNRIWDLGVHVIDQSCVENGTQLSTWELAGEDGVLVRGQRAARSSVLAGQLPSSYNLTFETNIHRAGTGWAVDTTAGGGAGIWMFLTSNLPSSTTFVNHNHTLLPANTLVLGAGSAPVNQSLFLGYRFAEEIEEHQWYTITTLSTDAQLYSVYIDSHLVLSNLNTSDYFIPAFSSMTGSATVGFAPWNEQVAYYRNVEVGDSKGAQVYRNSMQDPAVLAEFGVAPNDYSVCLDGAKRDRLVWTGDLHFAFNTIAVTTADWDMVRSTFDFVFDRRLASGGISTVSPMGAPAANAESWSTAFASFLLDYDLDLINEVFDYYQWTGDLAYVKKRWSALQALLAFVKTSVNPSTLLIDAFVFKGSSNGTTPAAMLVSSLTNLATLADALGDASTASAYRAEANATFHSIQNLLFNSTSGAFRTSLADSGFAYIDYAWSILSGIANPDQIQSQYPHLQSVRDKLGFRDSESKTFTGPYSALSPYLSGFLLEALLQQGLEGYSTFLLNGVFGAMAKPSENYTGASWEYVSYDGGPGIGLFTSLTHPWGSGATPGLTRHVLGVTPTSPGYATWKVEPVLLDLDWAEGTVPTPRGVITARWTRSSKTGKLNLVVEGPADTTGEVVVPLEKRNSTFAVDGQHEAGGRFVVAGGEKGTILEV